MRDNYSPSKGPGRYVCRHCGGDKLSFPGTGRWNAKEQRMEFEEDCEKPYCGNCEAPTTWAKFVPLDARQAPLLSRDYEGELFIVVDDSGEPVSDYSPSLDEIQHLRDTASVDGVDDAWAYYRIARVPLKVLVPDDGTPVEIVDDPLDQ